VADTKERLVEAALATIKEEGYGGTTARAIAGRAGVNQALIYYYYGDIKNLLLAALDETSAKRMQSYQALLEKTETIEDLAQLAKDIYREDLASGHVTVLSELIAGSLQHRELGPEVIRRLRPWIDFAEQSITKVTKGSVLETLIPARDVAVGIVAFYLGIDLLHQLDPADSPADRLFDHAARLAPGLEMLMAFGTLEEQK
jgi:AcrR family transcriptional regulator